MQGLALTATHQKRALDLFHINLCQSQNEDKTFLVTMFFEGYVKDNYYSRFEKKHK